MKPKLATMFLLALALLIWSAGCEREIVNASADSDDQDCFVCHGEDGLLLAAKGEWQNSVHASGNNVDYTNRGGTDCTRCHDHQGFLDYVATGEVDPPYDRVSAIHCFTCHSPHERGNLTLRVDDPYTLENGDVFDHGAGNLCAHCHHSRNGVDTYVTDDVSLSTHWGTHHGPQADLLNGSNGYEYAGVSYGTTPHASVGENQGCVLCHMGNPRTHIGYRIGGHSFNMEDEESGETLVGVCEQCHPDAEDFDHDGVQTEVNGLLDDLKVLLVDAGLVDDGGHPISQTLSDKDAAGAVWNFVMIEEDRSHGIHNPAYIRGLLQSSIDYMESIAGAAPKNIIPGPIAAH